MSNYEFEPLMPIYEKSYFNYMSKEKAKVKKKEVKSKELIFEQVYQQVMNSVYEKIDSFECFNIQFIEQCIIEELSKEFNNGEVAKILGVSIRTITNKKRKYGLRNLQ